MLVRDWPNTRVLITCRPIPAIRNEQDVVVDIPELTQSETSDLLSRFAPPLTPEDLLALPPSLHDALRRDQRTAAGAIAETEAHFSTMLLNSGSLLLRERALDIRDVCLQLLRQVRPNSAVFGVLGDTAIPDT